VSAVSALCDAVDGFVARESHTQSEAGEVFDAAVDRYNEFFFLAGFAFLFRATPWVLALVLAAIHGSFMVSYASARAEALRIAAPRGWMRRPERATYLTAGTALSAIAGTVSHADPSVTSPASIPMLAALLVVGVGANVSAAHRLIRVAQLAERRRQLAAPHGAAPHPGAAAHPVTRWAERFARR
jgi:phosphatidylglycerophosphate synthase